MAVRQTSEQLQKIRSLSEFGMGKSQIQKDKEQEERVKEMMPQPASSGYYRPSPPSMDAGYNLKEGLNPWDITMPTVPAILVCPTCKTDVDECEKLSDGSDSAFCRCPKCEVGYFIFELIKTKSWRRKM